MAAEKITAYRIGAEDATQQAWESAQRTASDSINRIKGLMPGLATALSAAGFIHLVRGSIDAMDHLNDLSKTTGLTVEALAGLKVAARQSGGDLDSIAASVNKLAVEMGKAPEKFRQLGITAKDPLEAFKQLADVFNKIEDPQQRAAVAAAALGKAWAGAAPLLSEGSKKIGEMVEAGTKASGITTEMAKQSDELNDKWILLVGSGGLMNAVVGRMLPTLLSVTNQMIALKEASESLSFLWDKITPPKIGGEFVTALKLLSGSKSVGRDLTGGMSLGSGPSGGRANVDRTPAGETAENAKAFLGQKKEAEKARKIEADNAQAFNNEMYSRQLIASAEAKEKELKQAEQLQNDLEILAFNGEAMRLQGEQEANTARVEEQQKQLESLQENLATEDELRQMHYDSDLELLNSTLGMKAGAQEEYYNLLGRLVLKSSLDQMAIERKKNEALRSMQVSTWQAGAELLQAYAGKSRAAALAVIAINKGLAIAQAIQATAVATMRAYSDLGPIAGTAAAAKIQVLGAVQIGLIAATGLVEAAGVGGGGADLGSPANPVNTTGGGFGAAAGPALAAPSQTTIIHLEGNDNTQFSGKQIRAFLKQIEESTRDGGKVMIG